jgi:hypothetical protein
MATTIKTFNSEGGFGIDETTLITKTLDIQNVNTFMLKSSHYSDASRMDYIVSGLNTGILTLDGVANIPIPTGTINFITGYVIGVNPTGDGLYSIKIESAVSSSSNGTISVLSELVTILKDSIPEGQNWTVSSFGTGTTNKFSYSTVRAGTSAVIKWIANVQVVSVVWQ